MVGKFFLWLQKGLDCTRCFDFLALIALRLYLVPIFWFAGTTKWNNLDDTIAWFGNPDWGLGLPFPNILAYLATYTEIVGAICLLVGFATRWISIPLMLVMAVAAFGVHWDNGWFAIADEGSQGSIRLQEFMQWVQTNEPQQHAYVTELGQPVMLNNGIEFSVTYFIMLFTLFFYGAGRFFSIDYWVARLFRKRYEYTPTSHL